MTTGYIVTGRGDLDAIFKARTSAAIANTNFKSNGGVDLAQRFEPRGATTAVANTGFKAGANDLAQLFMDSGAVVGTITITNVNWLATQPSTPTSTASSSHQLTAAGDINRLLNGVSSDEGDWVSPKAAAPSTFKVQVDVITGSFAAGSSATGVMLSLSAGPHTWTVSRATTSGVGSDTCTYQMTFFDGSGNFLAFTSNTLSAQITAAGTTNTTHTLVAGFDAPTQWIGYNRLGGAQPSIGTMTPNTTGTLRIDDCQYNSIPGSFSFLLSKATTPPDDDTSFQTLAINGTFLGGGSGTRSLTRSAASTTSTAAGGLGQMRSWTFNGTAVQLINGNSYTVTLTRT